MSTAKFNTLSNLAGSLTVPVATVVQGSAKAWVYFTVPAGTPIIQTAFNITSITDNGAGDYTFNFTSALVDANFAFAGLGTAGGANYQIAGGNIAGGVVRTTSSLRTPFGFVSSTGGALTAQDPASASIVVFR
jgi:hypothetical protein